MEKCIQGLAITRTCCKAKAKDLSSKAKDTKIVLQDSLRTRPRPRTNITEHLPKCIPFHQEHQFTTAVSSANDSFRLQSTIKASRLAAIVMLKTWKQQQHTKYYATEVSLTTDQTTKLTIYTSFLRQKFTLWFHNCVSEFAFTLDALPSVLWHCWQGIRNSIQLVKNWWVRCWCGYLSGAERSVNVLLNFNSWCYCDPIISCVIKIQTGLTFLVPAYTGFPQTEAVKRVSVYMLSEFQIYNTCTIFLLFNFKNTYWNYSSWRVDYILRCTLAECRQGELAILWTWLICYAHNHFKKSLPKICFKIT